MNSATHSIRRLCRISLTAIAPRCALLLAVPFLAAAKGDGCAANSRSPAPDVRGSWAIAYDDTLDVEVRLGGAVYTTQIGARGGEFTIEHEGNPIRFDLDCDRPEVLCPSEAWPTTVVAEQRDDRFEHRMIVTLPTQSCAGDLVDPDRSSCGAGTNNPDCSQVCDGEVRVREEERFGVIGEAGTSLRLYLGAGAVTNGVNCALLGLSLADARLGTSGSASSGDWRAETMEAGLVTVGFAGGCLWAGDSDMDGDLEALVLAAGIKLTTGFTGVRND